MMNILARANRQVLEELAWSNVLLAFDYDGTLAPIVASPERARIRRETRGLLDALGKLYPVVVISGRAQSDALDRLRGIDVCEVIGNHGMEPGCANDRYRTEVRRWLPVLNALISALRGVTVEDKGVSVAVHYRKSREKKNARAAIERAVAELGDVRVIGGKQVVNILPIGAPHKGIALLRERDRLRCDTALYVGDDDTDEDVFALDRPGRLLGVRVGASSSSSAPYCVANQRAVDDLLRALIEYRRMSGQRRRVMP
jgi:trehalose 6-phosphate phosphatase